MKEMDMVDVMRETRRGLNTFGRDITIDHTNVGTHTESITRFKEFRMLCKRILELSRPIK